MKYIGFCGAAKSGKTTLRDAVLLEMTRYEYKQHGTYYNADKASFATPLKEFCVQMLGLSYPQLYMDDKNTVTQYKWGQMPNYTIPDMDQCDSQERYAWGKKQESFMTAREVMQWWGTEVFRDMDEDFFVNKLKDDRDMGYDGDAYIDDVRFDNEAKLCDALIFVTSEELDNPDTHSSEQYKLLKPHFTINSRRLGIHLGLEQAAKQVCEFLHERFAK